MTRPEAKAPAVKLWHCYGCGWEGDILVCTRCGEGAMTLQCPEKPAVERRVPKRWQFEGIVSGRGLYRVGGGESCFYLQHIFDAFQEKRVRITVEVLDDEGGG